MRPTAGCGPMPERRRRLARRLLPAALLGLGFAACYSFHRQLGADPPRTLDPAAWGSDHVGQPVPAFVEGNECLFCHRFDVGTTWESNRHSCTVREVDPEAPALQALRQSPGLEALAG